jgi:hypothetical protein
VAAVAFFLLPEYLSLGARLHITCLRCRSTCSGYAGIVTLGRSAFQPAPMLPAYRQQVR